MPVEMQTLERLRERRPLFVFDLDSTVTRCELLPLLAEAVGIGREMAALTERAMLGKASFAEDFPRRAALLSSIPLSRARDIVAFAPVNVEIVRFLKENAQRCLIVTGNLDLWIETLIRRIGMEGRCLCSHGVEAGDRLKGVASVLDKAAEACRIPHPFVAIGDGSNDVGLMRAADLSIGFAGVREMAQMVRDAADMVTDDERELCDILRRLL